MHEILEKRVTYMLTKCRFIQTIKNYFLRSLLAVAIIPYAITTHMPQLEHEEESINSEIKVQVIPIKHSNIVKN